jgi:hypothetical protein
MRGHWWVVRSLVSWVELTCLSLAVLSIKDQMVADRSL